ncbi:MAG TPA: hypothetical protein PKM73_15440 [Verrucomicrobiota bacterium]|nr:hypothetical protein [Verrucomicrobiota bacterium]HNU51942.1 hypothetical protein [Verrucomicrobiota bacterium]
MEPMPYTVRRANLDDLPALQGLWETALLPALELERQLTDFQVVLRPDGILAGAVGLRIAANQGLLHSEAYYSSQQAADARPHAWARLKALAQNRGLVRLWLQGNPDPFWTELGFQTASAEEQQSIPPGFLTGNGPWSTLALREQLRIGSALERELEMFHASEQEAAERLRRQAAAVKWIGALIALGFLGGACILLFQVLRRQAGSRRR